MASRCLLVHQRCHPYPPLSFPVMLWFEELTPVLYCPVTFLPFVPFPLGQPASQLLIGLYTSILPNPRVSLTYRSASEQFALRITELLSVASSARLVVNGELLFVHFAP